MTHRGNSSISEVRQARIWLATRFRITEWVAHVVLRGKCLSVDEPIQGSTPALAILGSLTTLTPKYSLIICRVCTIAAVVSCANLHLLPSDKVEENDDFKKIRATDLQATLLINEYLVGVATSESWMTKRPNRVRMTR